jgi:hypothetical protein
MSNRLTGEAFTELVTRLHADAARDGRRASPGEVSAQVHALLQAAARPAARLTKSEGEKMLRTKKTKPTAKTPAAKKKPSTPRRSRPTKPSAPKPRVTIELAPDLAGSLTDPPPRQWFATSRPVLASAHDVEDVTPCYTCGGACEPDEDHHGPWRRHRECTRTTQMYQRRIAAGIFLAVPITETEAYVMTLPVLSFGDVHNHSATYDGRDHDRSPWNHIDRPALVRSLLEARQRIAEANGPAGCVSGWCAWCGRCEAEDWRLYGHRWTDGTEAPLCGDCGDVFDHAGTSAAFIDDQRTGLVEAITGCPPMMGENAPPGLLAYLEVEGRGDGTAWSHLPADAVAALRWSRWGRYNGRYAPEEHRAEAVARAQAREAARADRQALRESPDLYGFTRTGTGEGESEGQG